MRTPLTLLFLAGATLSAQSTDRISILEGSVATDLRVRVVDERAPAATGTVVLSGLQILAIEVTNRTTQMSFVPGRSRLATRQGLRTVELPSGGRLLRYRRGNPALYGFLWIDAGGAAVVVHELPGVGAGRTDPYEDRIGVAPDGRHAVLLTTGGALQLVRLDGQMFASTNTYSRQLALPAGPLPEKLAVAVGPTHLFFVTDDARIWRCALADRNQPVDLTPAGPANVRLKDELAPSGDGQAVAFLYGPKDLYSIFLLHSTGAAIRLSPKAAKYEEPGYLPDFVGGPRLLLNHDATRLLYVDATLRDEIFVTDTVGSSGTTHITSDRNFQPYIGVGILPAFAGATLTLAVGDPQRFDWFRATTASRAVTNLTNTGPQKTPPFASGALLPTTGFPTGDGRLITSESAGGNVRVRMLDPGKATSSILMQAARGNPELGAALGGAPTVLLPGHLGDMFLRLQPSGPVLIGPPGVHLSAEVFAPVGWFSVFTARAANAPSGPVLPVIRLQAGAIEVLPPVAGLRQIVLTRSGGAVFNGSALQHLGTGGATAMVGGSSIQIVLSGASQ